MKNILFFLVCFSTFTGFLHAQDAPLTYKTPNGDLKTVTLISGVNSAGVPLVNSYTGNDGTQRVPLVIANVCSVTNGIAKLCVNTNNSAGLVISSVPYSNLPKTEDIDNILLICSDCTYNGSSSIILKWSKSLGKWETLDNIPVTSANIRTVYYAPVTPFVANYQTLPSSPPDGTEVFCTNCWSTSYSNGKNDEGVKINYLAGKWRDASGAPVNYAEGN